MSLTTEKHPDIETLAALAENGTALIDRQQLTDHLHDCADCYDLFAAMLAAQDDEDEAETEDDDARWAEAEADVVPLSSGRASRHLPLWLPIAASFLLGSLALWLFLARQPATDVSALYQTALERLASHAGERVWRFEYPRPVDARVLAQAQRQRGARDWQPIQSPELQTTLDQLAALLAEKPDDVALRADLASLYLAVGDLDRALVTAAALPEDTPAYGLVHLLHYLKGQTTAQQEALVGLQLLAEQHQNEPFLAYNLAVLCEEQGRRDEADRWFARYLALVPDSPRAAELKPRGD